MKTPKNFEIRGQWRKKAPGLIEASDMPVALSRAKTLIAKEKCMPSALLHLT
jgi:hypothetical protein